MNLHFEEWIVLSGRQEDVAAARIFIRKALADDYYDLCRDDVVLVVSELVTNAVVYAAGEIVVRLIVDDHCVRVEVTDGSNVLPRLAESVPTSALGGRGLPLVTMVSEQWGARPTTVGGKTVWCELSVS